MMNSRRDFILAALAASVAAGSGGYALWSVDRDTRKLLSEFDRESADPELLALRSLLHQPGPAEQKLKMMNISVPFYEPDFGLFVDGPYRRETHLFHWRHHYLEYLRRWQVAVDALESNGLADHTHQENVMKYGTLALLHAHYWKQFVIPGHGKMMSVRDAKTWGSRIEKWILKSGVQPDWFLILRNRDGDLIPIGLTSNNTFIPERNEVVLAIDLMSHAWRLDFDSLKQGIEGFLESVKVEVSDVLNQTDFDSKQMENISVRNSQQLPAFNNQLV